MEQATAKLKRVGLIAGLIVFLGIGYAMMNAGTDHAEPRPTKTQVVPEYVPVEPQEEEPTEEPETPSHTDDDTDTHPGDGGGSGRVCVGGKWVRACSAATLP